MQHDAVITAKGSKFRHLVRVEVHLKDGTRMERTVEAGRGNENNFASEAEVVEKFEKLAMHVLPRPQVEQLRDAMLGSNRSRMRRSLRGCYKMGQAGKNSVGRT